MMTVTKVMGMVHCKSTALGGQTQQETANKAAGQDNVPFDKVCGLYRRDKNTNETMRSLRSKANSKFYPFIVIRASMH